LKYLPATLPGGYELVGLNERLRFLRYDLGGAFAPHSDGSYPRPREHPNYGDISRVTVQIYLNEGFEGGTTRFFPFESHINDEHFDIISQTGALLLFEHPLRHSGELVTQGRKYCLRTDVMYRKKNKAETIAADTSSELKKCATKSVQCINNKIIYFLF
jgi:hypothetical protein